MKRYGVSHTAAEEKIDELIRWWKFKNRTHRALTSDDRKALTMIVTEFGLRRKQETVRGRWYSWCEPIIPTELLISNRVEEPGVCRMEFNWERKKEGVVLHNRYLDTSRYCYSRKGPPWEADHMGRKLTGIYKIRDWPMN